MVALEPLCSNNIGDAGLHASANKGGVAIHLCIEHPQADVDLSGVVEQTVLEQIDGQAVERGHHSHLESSLVESLLALPLSTLLMLLLFG